MYLVVSDDWTSDCYFKKREYSSIVLIQKKKKKEGQYNIIYLVYSSQEHILHVPWQY